MLVPGTGRISPVTGAPRARTTVRGHPRGRRRPTYRALNCAACSSRGAGPACATSGAEAWEIIAGHPPPLLAILDWSMPAPNGPELCRRSALPRAGMVYAMLLTAPEPRGRAGGPGAGRDDYLTKPCDPRSCSPASTVGVRMLGLQESLARRVRDLEEALAKVKQLRDPAAHLLLLQEHPQRPGLLAAGRALHRRARRREVQPRHLPAVLRQGGQAPVGSLPAATPPAPPLRPRRGHAMTLLTTPPQQPPGPLPGTRPGPDHPEPRLRTARLLAHPRRGLGALAGASATACWPSPTPRRALSVMVELGLLTHYQAARISTGNTFGLVLGNYRVLDRLGAGGMGVVYKAEHIEMRRLVAIKVLQLAARRRPAPAVALHRRDAGHRPAAAPEHRRRHGRRPRPQPRRRRAGAALLRHGVRARARTWKIRPRRRARCRRPRRAT